MSSSVATTINAGGCLDSSLDQQQSINPSYTVALPDY